MTETPSETESLPESTVPKDLQIHLRGFLNTDEANKVGNVVSEALVALGRYIKLDGLDGVTVAYDYPDALRLLDRGFQTSRELKPTTEGPIGIAMTPRVIRGGRVMSHIIVHAGILEPLTSPDSPEFILNSPEFSRHPAGSVFAVVRI